MSGINLEDIGKEIIENKLVESKTKITTIGLHEDVKIKLMDLQFTILRKQNLLKISHSDVVKLALDLLEKKLKKDFGEILSVPGKTMPKSGRN